MCGTEDEKGGNGGKGRNEAARGKEKGGGEVIKS